MPNLNLIAVLTPAKGKEDRLMELFKPLLKAVHANEPGCLRYHLQKATKGDEYIVMETYESEKALEVHRDSPEYKNFFKVVQEESLLATHPQLFACEAIAGFDNRSDGLVQ